MVYVKRMVLDVLKPHQPNGLVFCKKIAESGENYHVGLTVLEVDENTETLQIVVTGDNLDFEGIQQTINELGGSLHSIDEVEVQSDSRVTE